METDSTYSVQSSLNSHPVYLYNHVFFILRRYLLDQRIIKFEQQLFKIWVIDFK